MALLIDGYNLLHVTGIVSRGAKSFQRSRQAMLSLLAASIEPSELPRSVIVFDAADAPPGLPKTLDHNGLTVHYARDYPDADTMIEELIRQHDTPRSLTVVSSDHRIQRAARRRKAHMVDSDRWYAELLAKRRQRESSSERVETKPDGTLDAGEVAYWLAQFGDVVSDVAGDVEIEDATSLDETTPDSSDSPENAFDDSFDDANPFPPGYADDLLEGEDL